MLFHSNILKENNVNDKKIAQTLEGNRVLVCVNNDALMDYAFGIRHTH